jgi:hypothetical protein
MERRPFRRRRTSEESMTMEPGEERLWSIAAQTTARADQERLDELSIPPEDEDWPREHDEYAWWEDLAFHETVAAAALTSAHAAASGRRAAPALPVRTAAQARGRAR